MESNGASPRAIWLSLLGALIAVAGVYAVLVGAGWVAPLLAAFAQHPWLRPIPGLVSCAAGAWSYYWLRRSHREKSAAKR
jgi:hypothetical protein